MDPRSPWEDDFHKRTRAWRDRLTRWMFNNGFDYKLNSVQKFFYLICEQKNFDIGTFVSLRPEIVPVAEDYAHPPWTMPDEKVRAMFLAELHQCASLYFRFELQRKTPQPRTEDTVAEECRAFLRDAKLDDIAKLPSTTTSPLLGVYNPVKDLIFTRTSPLSWHLRSLRHCMAIVIQERTRSKAWYELPDEIDPDEVQQEVLDAINTDADRALGPAPKQVPQECQVAFSDFVSSLGHDEQDEKKQSMPIPHRLENWYERETEQSGNDFNKAKSPVQWDTIQKYQIALGTQTLIKRVCSVARELDTSLAFEEMAQKVRKECKPNDTRLEARSRLAKLSKLCNIGAGFEAIRKSLTWILGDNEGKGARIGNMTNDDIRHRLTESIHEIAFIKVFPKNNVRDIGIGRIREEAEKLSKQIVRDTEWFIDKVNVMIQKAGQIRFAAQYQLTRMETSCRDSFAFLITPDVRRLPLSSDLINVLREIVQFSNLRAVDLNVARLVRDLIPTDINIGFVTLDPCADWAAATFAVVDRRVSPNDEMTPLTTSALIDIYVSQLLCTVRFPANKILADYECP